MNREILFRGKPKDLAQWADRKELFNTCEFKDFEPRKGFKCEEYFI
jgi:hypothetical protein